MDPRAAPRSFSVRNEIEPVRIRCITAVKQGQIEITSVAFLPFLEPARRQVERAGSLFTNPVTRGIVRAVCRLGDSGTTAR